MPSRYTNLVKQLIDAGVATKYVARLREELDDHYADLEAELLTEKSAERARYEAARRLGEPADILAEFAKRPQLKSFVYRSRGVIFVLRLVASFMLSSLHLLHWLGARKGGATRLVTAIGAAALVTCALLLAMSLVTMTEWSRPEHNVASRAAEAEGQRLAELPTSAPKPPPIRISLPDPLREVAPELRAVAWSTEVSVEARPGPMVLPRPNDSEYHPLVKTAPIYPALAASNGIEGYVVVEFTVTRSGSVKDVVVVQSSDDLFVEAAVQATYKFKYKPRIIDGEPIEVSGVRNRISFRVRA